MAKCLQLKQRRDPPHHTTVVILHCIEPERLTDSTSPAQLVMLQVYFLPTPKSQQHASHLLLQQ